MTERQTQLIGWLERYGLGLLVAVVIVKGVALSFVIPPWEIPDEPAHFEYVQSIVENQRFPQLRGSALSISPEVFTSLMSSNFYGRRTELQVRNYLKPPADNINVRMVAGRQENPAALYNPSYYLLMAAPYRVFSALPVEGRLIAMRMLSVVLFGVVVVFTYAGAMYVRRSALFALTVASLVGLHPMASFMFSGVNNDVMVAAACAVVWYLLGRMLQRPITMKTVITAALLIGFSISFKQQAAIFLALSVAVLWYRRKLLSGRFTLAVLVLIAVSTAIGAGWNVLNAGQVHQAPGLLIPENSLFARQPFDWLVGQLVFVRWPEVFKSFWGYFGWLNAPLPQAVYAFLAAAVTLAGLGLLSIPFVKRPRLHLNLVVAGLSVSAVGLLESLYSVIFWHYVRNYAYFHFPNQGRYYFILLPALMLLLVLGLEWIFPDRMQRNVWLWSSLGMMLLFGISIPLMIN